jgi:hypothetical protein
LIETHSLPNSLAASPSQLYLDHSHGPVLAPATCLADPIGSAADFEQI